MTGLEGITPILLSLLGVTAGVAGVFFWRMLTRMEDKIDKWWEEHRLCRERQEDVFVKKNEFKEWKQGRRDLWNRIHGHKHDLNGRVVITEKVE
jgi:hypothetical protein